MALVLIFLLVPGCSGDDKPMIDARSGACNQPGSVEIGTASWYGEPHHGRRTASGSLYDMNGLTAAHRRLGFGTRIAVTNLANGRSVNLVVTDRGPYVRGRILDVSRRAADELGFRGDGLARVRISTLTDCL